jgi:2-amino-4-hydroxy-6-hydroxymethyldihydropteridine diphosphokinase
MPERLAWVGLGANLGDAASTVRAALARIATLPGSRLLAKSSLYRSAPVDAGGDDYVNAVARIATTLDPHDLLAALMQIEQAFGRQRSTRNAPRTLDLDLLMMQDVMMQDVQLQTPELTLPHPRMHQRAFVLLPLAEIDPDLTIPGQEALEDLIRATANQPVQRLT